MALKDYGVCGQLLVAVQSLYEDGWARVRVGRSDGCLCLYWLLLLQAQTH